MIFVPKDSSILGLIVADTGTGCNYANGLAFHPWGRDSMTGGSSDCCCDVFYGDFAITKDTEGSTNPLRLCETTSLTTYDPPKYHF
jgi:hypothetical protein